MAKRAIKKSQTSNASASSNCGCGCLPTTKK
jgi:hypothetical protein